MHIEMKLALCAVIVFVAIAVAFAEDDLYLKGDVFFYVIFARCQGFFVV
jgi:hypothetical protein